MISEFLKSINIHPDWQPFLSENTTKGLARIDKEVFKSDYTPGKDKVLRFLSVPLKTAKIVIIGQDPYPQPGVATGRAFEVGTLRSWSEPFSNISLKNILRAIYKAYSGEVIRYNELKAKFDNEFPVLPPNKLFASWEDQGVLLLNTSFTCIPGSPGSHKNIWGEFSEKLFEYIQKINPGLYWFLWGNHAQQATENLSLKNAVRTMHPMMCHKKPGRDSDFLFGETNCFELTKDTVDWTGYQKQEMFRPSGKLF